MHKWDNMEVFFGGVKGLHHSVGNENDSDDGRGCLFTPSFPLLSILKSKNIAITRTVMCASHFIMPKRKSMYEWFVPFATHNTEKKLLTTPTAARVGEEEELKRDV